MRHCTLMLALGMVDDTCSSHPAAEQRVELENGLVDREARERAGQTGAYSTEYATPQGP